MKKSLIALPVILLAACSRSGAPDMRPALDGITADGLMQHVRILSSDEFEGRAPATKGEELTVNYLTAQFQKLGLAPGNPDGTYVQKVPMVGIKSETETGIIARGKKLALTPLEDYVAISQRVTPEVHVKDSDVVFVGYGVVAPEYGWDDYKGVDVKGKTIVLLVNDPLVPDSKDPTKLDPAMFKGKAMTYYGRWTYKFEIATEKGAAAALIVHETGPAGYPFGVVIDSWGRENFNIQKPDHNMKRVSVEGWITLEKARELFRMSGLDFEKAKNAAERKDFKPVPLNAKADFDVKNTVREVVSRNVVGKLDGSDPRLKNEDVIYTAHWDHLGRNPALKGDQIFNGALDNASGVACLLEIAQAFTRLPEKPKRSMLFLSVTGEEQGLLGSAYYAANPLYPLKNTLADINIDGFNQWGRTRDIEIIGYGNSTLDDVTAEVAASQGRVVKPGSHPEKGSFYRSDHFELAKLGVPALYVDSGRDYIGKPPGFGDRKEDEFTEKDYHKVTDEIKPDWDLSGAVEDVQLLFQVGYRVAQADKYPAWKPGTEFRAKREAMFR